MDTSTHSRLSLLAVMAAAFATTFAPAANAQATQAVRERIVMAQDHGCRNCGVVQSVERVQRRGQPQGIAGTQVTPGMAIGGLVGGVLGNQVGHGTGRAAATVVGAAGGAYAGNAIEKNSAKYTAYVIRIRMPDGSMRTVEQRNPITRGTRVVVEGHTARIASNHG